ncbi:DeoR/GlpR family DNA-binding transcription regulator [Stappia sp. 28M-7]|uniref:DeoR/GlpR family DNA-binding transcription regulator n=1 Tax=Stappia sp. 28M-7 TaxID=2762596 RepID=UPI000E74099C|nr:DeoR/GlpR family DNA-binding transcription regulator [Stappia sp. 28M-7]MBC2861871.1 DeoR/GlpR transcriptional regulator [Stappia sp. 28M-7]
MEPVTPRQSEILDRARRAGRVDVDGLSTEFDVTPQTIRKDLNELCERGMLQRVHGGAVLPSGIANYAYDARRQLAADEKRRIGLRAAGLIPDNASIMLNIGTTTEQVARALRQHDGIMAITNNINVANILRAAPAVEVIIAGGQVRASDGGIVGEAAAEFIRQFKVDYALIGASAIDPDGTIFDYDFREVRVAREIITHARQTILVADSMKFERSAPVRIAHISQIDIFVTDKAPPEPLVEICREHGVRIEIAGDGDTDRPDTEREDGRGAQGK